MAIVRTATSRFARQVYLTASASAQYWDANVADLTTKMVQAKQYFIIYNGKLTEKEMQNICLVTYKYICFMSAQPNYTGDQLDESDMILGKLDPPWYNINKDVA